MKFQFMESKSHDTHRLEIKIKKFEIPSQFGATRSMVITALSEEKLLQLFCIERFYMVKKFKLTPSKLELAGLVLHGMTKTVQQPRGHWTVEGSKNVRRFFDQYAKIHNKDPLDPKTWYSIKLKDITDLPVCTFFPFLPSPDLSPPVPAPSLKSALGALFYIPSLSSNLMPIFPV
jgi:hypothetical protein